jgi:hypothetical protein
VHINIENQQCAHKHRPSTICGTHLISVSPAGAVRAHYGRCKAPETRIHAPRGAARRLKLFACAVKLYQAMSQNEFRTGLEGGLQPHVEMRTGRDLRSYPRDGSRRRRQARAPGQEQPLWPFRHRSPPFSTYDQRLGTRIPCVCHRRIGQMSVLAEWLAKTCKFLTSKINFRLFHFSRVLPDAKIGSAGEEGRLVRFEPRSGRPPVRPEGRINRER